METQSDFLATYWFLLLFALGVWLFITTAIMYNIISKASKAIEINQEVFKQTKFLEFLAKKNGMTHDEVVEIQEKSKEIKHHNPLTNP